MEKAKFKEIFDKCMEVNRAWQCHSPEDCYWVDVEPKCVIRDFSIDVTDMQQTGVWDASRVDTEFNDFEKAWAYLQDVYPQCRVMDAGGQIYYDFYDTDDTDLATEKLGEVAQ